MIKIITILLIMINTLNAAYEEVNQNMKALYKDVDLTEIQENYILDNQDKNINILENIMKEEIKKIDTKFMNDKNVIEFILNENGTIDKVKFLKKSDDRNLDKITEKIIEQASKKMMIPKEKTPMRFIFIYEIGQNIVNNQPNDNTNTVSSNTYEIPISRGTTRFEHTSKEYVRVFETNRDGFVNFNVSPTMCNKNVALLTEKGQKINHGYAYWNFNVEVPKGKYKLLVQTKQTCDVNLQYP
jgi:hypothetical protein